MAAGSRRDPKQEKGGSVLVKEVYMQLGSDGTAGARPMEGSSNFPGKARMDHGQRLLMRSPVLATGLPAIYPLPAYLPSSSSRSRQAAAGGPLNLE